MLRDFKIIPAYTSSSSSALFWLPKAAVWVLTLLHFQLKVQFLQPHGTTVVTLFGGWVPAHIPQVLIPNTLISLDDSIRNPGLWPNVSSDGITQFMEAPPELRGCPWMCRCGAFEWEQPHIQPQVPAQRGFDCTLCPSTCIPGLKEKIPTGAQGPEPAAGSEICSWDSERNTSLSKAQNFIFVPTLCCSRAKREGSTSYSGTTDDDSPAVMLESL